MAFSQTYKVHAVILKRKNVGEADRVITIFTKEYGKLRVLGKGIRKITSRRGPHLEVFSSVILMLHRGKTWDIVSETQSLDQYSLLRKKLGRVSLAYYLCELIDGLTPEKQEHRDVFSLTTDTLQTLNSTGPVNLPDMRDRFSLELLHMLGFLSRSRVFEGDQLEHYIESIIEKRLKTPKIMHQLA